MPVYPPTPPTPVAPGEGTPSSLRLGGRFSLNDYEIEQTKTLLDIDGEYISLHREAEWVDDGAGGQTRAEEDGPTIAKQLFWFFEAAPIAHIARGSNFQETIGMGQRVTTNYVLVGMPDANMRQGDTFWRDGEPYVIEFVHPDRKFMTLGEVERISDPQGDEDLEPADEDLEASD